MNDDSRFAKQVRFILELDKEKTILRQTHLTGYRRQENDAEHAWHMGVMACLLKEYANEPFDLARTLLMILLHDVVEIDAGDTYAYDPDAVKTQREREEKAADRIFGLLPEGQAREFRDLFEEFDRGDTPEARYAHALDNFQPILLNDANNGKDWRLHQVGRQQVEERNARTHEGSEKIAQAVQAIIDRNVEKGNLKP
ncbi:HD domain-containing protein [uncultured Acidaminococcus sp.]|uniref:HD domain-containing protein n=1 Tax=uncultured Acidaminococcus sp. TaxID=352152 RepID=UPI0029428272|nr:HD domain-containing protein [uncultured Acidaminococcus sp.]